VCQTFFYPQQIFYSKIISSANAQCTEHKYYSKRVWGPSFFSGSRYDKLFMSHVNRKENMNPEIIGLVAGIFTTGAAVPQIIKSHKAKTSKDISLIMFSALVFGFFLWLWYGVSIKSLPLALWNIAAIILNGTILIQKIYYDSRG
jgi:MtN3 and saliva related transmembrane protein